MVGRTDIMNTLNNKNCIKNISYNQKEILWNIMQLYNNGEPFDCDITASSLKFYETKPSDEYIIPEPRLLFDVFPQQSKIGKIEPFKPIPIENNSLSSIVADLPFVICPKKAPSMVGDKINNNLIARRFASFYPYQEAYENHYWWIRECYDKLSDGGILVWKMQDTISGGINHSFIEFDKICAQDVGFYVIDEFLLIAKSRLISATKIKKQQHARKYTSSFVVFKKDKKTAEKYSPLNILQTCKSGVFEGKEWQVK